MYYVYVLRSLKDSKLYYGLTGNLRQRLKDHNNGLNRSTRGRMPFELIYYEAYVSETDAKNRELFMKSGRGREMIRKHLSDTLKAEMAELVKARV